ncbi:MAG: Asp-tRNA(Asn)/Glu-tRNA(Gln) amidotransferase subunit GatB [Phycisphaerales bacterium]|nr:Asp-tRNA(Asn)/Glu-tRNA(Gln) amidotransferase subunit GatB [Phycisphaerales bacterium]
MAAATPARSPAATHSYTEADIASVRLMVGLEVHVELATRTKMFSRSPNVAHKEFDGAEPNTLIDPVVLGLPGALPVMNKAAVEMSMMVGMALGCSIAPFTRWDRKSYYYPDLPKNYQISQYQLPLCFDGSVEMPVPAGGGGGGASAPDLPRRIGIIRAHLEEDAGKLLHEAPGVMGGGGGGRPIDFSLVDLNRAGTPLLEIVTQPDFSSADDVVLFAQHLRNICRFLGATEGVMQKGHMRFEPNINTIITLSDGRLAKTPIIEIKNLNSFKALRGAIEFELADQPRRWLADGREMGAGTKFTRGWDDQAMRTMIQREKEDAHDYRYFPEPDLLPVTVDDTWREEVRARIPELPSSRLARYRHDFNLGHKEAAALVDERDVCFFYERCVAEAQALGVDYPRAGKQAANMVLQSGAKRANERAVLASELGITPAQIAAIIKLREDDTLTSTSADELFGLLCEPGQSGIDAAQLATTRGMMTVRDEGALEKWVDQAIAENAKVADDVRSGKVAAAGRLVGVVMKLSGGTADAKVVREKVLAKLGQPIR